MNFTFSDLLSVIVSSQIEGVVMTSLAYQLKRLALPQSDPNLLTRKEVTSLLFDPKDAATMDRSTFYALGESPSHPETSNLHRPLTSLPASRLHRAGGAAGNRAGLPGIPGHAVQ